MYPTTFSLRPPGSSTTSNMFERWMRLHFKLAVLLLAKVLWDTRQRPAQAARSLAGSPLWPAKPLTRALRHMASPCVAGDLLQQRAPRLVPHVHRARSIMHSLAGTRWEVTEQPMSAIPGYGVGSLLSAAAGPVRTCVSDNVKFGEVGGLHCLPPHPGWMCTCPNLNT
jgi:hypothetical protein